MNKYPGQICQDEKTNEDFRVLHHEIVNSILKFCKEHNISADECYVSIDGMSESVPFGQWQACTDSSFSLFIKNETPYLRSL